MNDERAIPASTTVCGASCAALNQALALAIADAAMSHSTACSMSTWVEGQQIATTTSPQFWTSRRLELSPWQDTTGARCSCHPSSVLYHIGVAYDKLSCHSEYIRRRVPHIICLALLCNFPLEMFLNPASVLHGDSVDRWTASSETGGFSITPVPREPISYRTGDSFLDGWIVLSLVAHVHVGKAFP